MCLSDSCLFSFLDLYYTHRPRQAEYKGKENFHMPNETTNKFSLVDLPEIPNSVDNAFQNLIDKPTKNIGETFANIWFLVFGGLSQMADKKKMKYAMDLEQYKLELEKSISRIPADRKIEPSIQVTAQALENSKYCIEEPELRTMFSSLISNSMNLDYLSDVHPSFAEMIKQMSPLDAQLLKIFKDGPPSGFPICDFHRKADNGTYYVLAENVFVEFQPENPREVSRALTSLSRLGLLSLSQEVYLANDALYKKFETCEFYKNFKDSFPSANITIKKRKATLTPLGNSFVKVCIPD